MFGEEKMVKAIKGILYWFWSYTYGCIMTIIGTIIALCLLITGHKPHRFHYNIYFTVGECWGGLELGAFFIMDKNCGYMTAAHEAGHGIQNLILGPLLPFIVCIPSAVRYWLFQFKTQKARYLYATILFLVGSVISGALVTIGFVFNIIPLYVIGFIVLAYFIYILIWLTCGQIPKFKSGRPLYDSFWVEGLATKWGMKYFTREGTKFEIHNKNI